jgi:hypothetical protein
MLTIKTSSMKSINIKVGIMIMILGVGLIVSCTKTFDEEIELQSNFYNNSIVQVVVPMVGAARNTLYVDGAPVTGALLVTGSIFPTTGYGFAAPPGLHNYTIKDTLRTSTQIALNFAENLQTGKNYTIFVYDTTTAPKQLTVPTNIVIPEDSTSRLRFANFVYSTTATTGVDVFSKRQNKNIFTNVGRTQVTEFIPMPSASTTVEYIPNTNDTLFIRETGTMNLLVQVNGVNPTQKRSYTLLYRGSQKGVKAATYFANF